jgi:hypothetical protein
MWARKRSYETVPAMMRAFEAKETVFTVDTDIDPFCPRGWRIESTRRCGRVEIDISRIERRLSKVQRDGGRLTCDQFLAEFGWVGLTAHALDWLLAHKELIPESWKGRLLFFPGTVYQFHVGNRCIRYLVFEGGDRGWSEGWLGADFDIGCQVALLASS